MALKRKNSSKSDIREIGYLFCNHCGGYYKLKKGESPRDFAKCECGNPLEFCKTKKELDKHVHNLNRNKEVFSHFENRMLKRRESLQNIFPKVGIDDDFIKNMQEKEELWDILDNNLFAKESNTNIESDINRKKKYLDIVLEEERLMMSIGEKRTSVKNQTFLDKIFSFFSRTDPTIILAVIIILLITILSVNVLNSYIA